MPQGFWEDINISLKYFRYFVIISPWKRTWTMLNPLHPTMFCVKFGWNWQSGCGEEDFSISSMNFRYFVIYLLLKKAVALHLNKLESLSSMNDLCQVWVKLASGSGENENWKVNRWSDGIPCDRKSSLKLSAQVSWKNLWPFSSMGKTFVSCFSNKI